MLAQSTPGLIDTASSRAAIASSGLDANVKAAIDGRVGAVGDSDREVRFFAGMKDTSRNMTGRQIGSLVAVPRLASRRLA
jgi:hypothetical protein